MRLEFLSTSTTDTEQIAEKFADRLSGGEVIAFCGGLGMGKTCFTRGLARGLEFTGETNSPTFAIVNEYRGGRLPLFHFDMYRISSWEDLYSCGYFDLLDEGGVIAVEWSENIASALPDDVINVSIEKGENENERKITITRGEAE